MTNEHRLITLLDSPLQNQRLTLTEVIGEDYLSSPFYFTLTLTTDDTPIDLRALNKKPISFSLGHSEPKIYHGFIYQAEYSDTALSPTRTVTLVVRPWLQWLDHTTDSRIYAVDNPMSVVDIVESVFQKHGFSDYRVNLSNPYPPVELCVQYKESDLNFISRLLEQAGIYYYFIHDTERATLILDDNPSPTVGQHEQARYRSDSHTQAHIQHWQATARPRLAMAMAQHYQFTQPSELVTNTATTEPTGLPETLLAKYFAHTNLPANSNAQTLKAHNQRKLQFGMINIVGKSHYPHWQAGTAFSFTHPELASQTGDYYLYAILHHAVDNSGSPHQENEQPAQHYENTFRAYQHKEPFTPLARYQSSPPQRSTYRLERATFATFISQRPALKGVFIATVTGPKDTPIYTDKYGRVKVQFDWDSHSQNNENSFAWVRVKQAWGSDKSGLHFTPRVGEQVLVSFQHGSPEQPVIVGSLPDDSHLPPFTPAITPEQSGFHSQSLSTTPGQESVTGHVVKFDDSATTPTLNIESYRDMDLTTANHHTLTVQGKTTTTVKQGNYIEVIDKKLVINASTSVTLVNGDSHILITPTDITLQAKKISLGKGAAANSATSASPASTSSATASTSSATATPPQPAKPTQPAQHTTTTTKEQQYWLVLSYPNLNATVPPPAQAFTLSTQTQARQKATDIKAFTGTLNAHGIGSQSIDKATAIHHLQLNGSDIIRLNGKAQPIITTGAALTANDWTAAKANDVSGATLQPGAKQLTAELLFPAIVKNLRQGAAEADGILTPAELDYFKHNGNNAMVFIHGYNVPFGAFPQRLNDIEVGFDDVNSQLDIQYGQGDRTFYNDIEMLQQQFPDVAQLLTMDSKTGNLPPELSSSTDASNDALNGTDAHNWFIHMEDNLNRATNQFQRDDYTQYTRCVHVAWSGDCGALNYIQATQQADRSVDKLVSLLSQLQAADIHINILAHSLGNRVLLGALDRLGARKPAGIEHVFMWEPAVSELALSSHPIKDNSFIQHDFPNAMQAVNKVTVLYNQYDTILAVPYWLASYFGIDVGDRLLQFLNNTAKLGVVSLIEHSIGGRIIGSVENLIDNFKDGLIRTYPSIQDRLRAVLYDKDFNHLIVQWAEAFQLHPHDDTKVRANMNNIAPILKRYAQQFGCAQALGFGGPNINNPETNHLMRAGRVISANMSKWATGHSYMHIPSADVMKHGYKQWIINRPYGVNSFGVYSPSDFPQGEQ